MKMSEQRKQHMYNAIHEEIMQLRMKLQREHELPEFVDYKVAQLVSPIYKRVKAALNVEEN